MVELALKRSSAIDRELYANLSSRSEVEASAPGVFFWSGEHAVLHGGVGVCQQAPLRVWVGLHRTQDADAVRIRPDPDGDHHQVCDPGSPRYGGMSPLRRTLEWNKVAPALDWLGSWATEHHVPSGVYTFRSIHEVRPASGCNWSGAFANALVACVLQEAGVLNMPAVKSWRTSPYVQLATAVDDILDPPEIWTRDAFNRLALKVETMLHQGRASGYGTLCSAIAERGPVLYVTGDRVSEGIASDLTGKLDQVDRLTTAAIPLTQIVNAPEDVLETMPIAYGLIYTGEMKQTGEAVKKTERIGVQFQNDLSDLVKVLGRQELAEIIKRNARLRAIVDGEVDGDYLRQEQMRAVGSSSIRVYMALTTLISSVMAERRGDSTATEVAADVEALASALRRNQGGLTQLGLEWRKGRAVAEAIYEWAHHGEFIRSTAVKLTGGGGGGQVVMMIPDDKARYEVIDQKLETTRKFFGSLQDIRLEWLSTVDGFDGHGLLVKMGKEQRIVL